MSIHRRVAKSGVTTWVVRYRDPIPRERTFDRKADAERFERYVRHQLDTDQYLDPDSARITMREWAERWWPTIVNSQRAPSTISGYEGALRLYVLPHSGRPSIADAPADRHRGVARGTPERRVLELHHPRRPHRCRHDPHLGSRRPHHSSNPLAGLRLPMTSSRTRHALTVEQVEAIAETVDPWWRTYVLVLAYCGLRPGEAVALQRRDLDDLGRLTVERGISEHRGRLIEQDTKTHRARIVQVPASVLRELREHLEAHVGPDPESPIFTTPAGNRVRMSNWRHKIWDPTALELELPQWATPYVLRHTAASLMAQQGVPVSAAAAALGHDPAIFLRTYAHLYPGDLRGVADAMDVARQSARRRSQ